MMRCVCGCDYFGSMPISQTAPDGRLNIHGSDVVSPWEVMLVCVSCGKRWIYPDKCRSGKELVEAGTPESMRLLDENRIDFGKSMDPRQEKRDASLA